MRDCAELWDGNLPVRQDLEEHRFKLLVYLVHFVNEQNALLWLMPKRLHQRALHEKIQRVQPSSNGLPFGPEFAGLGIEEKFLQGRIEPTDRLLLIDTRIALQPLQFCVERNIMAFANSVCRSPAGLRSEWAFALRPQGEPAGSCPRQGGTWLLRTWPAARLRTERASPVLLSDHGLVR